jgi:TOMM system kinase/cyclase fusion protein
LLDLLGEGGNGAVYKAMQISTGKTVALKLLHQKTDGDASANKRLLERFERETRLCAQLHHPHIVQLLDKGQAPQQQLFAVFEYVPGETLRSLLQRKGALSAPEAGELMGQVLDALACAHAAGIAHRDLKPQNIMVSTTGKRLHVKVLDFGIAAFIPDRQANDYRNLTLTQETLCSPSYSAPEQLRGEPPTVKIDLYAWGLLLIECLTGQAAISGITLAEIFHKQLSAMEVPIPPALIGHPLADLLHKVLRKNPLERAESAATLYDEFQRINLANIVGELLPDGIRNQPGRAATGPDKAMWQANQDLAAITQTVLPASFSRAYQRQQITVLSCTLNASTLSPNDSEATLEALEAVQSDQLNLCADIALRHGGHTAGSLGNSMMFYFGYPELLDDDARRCARTALELVGKVRHRSALLAPQGFRLDIRMAIHTGMIRMMHGLQPSGVTPNTALQLERLARPGTVLVSATSRRLLDQYVEFEDIVHTFEIDSGETLPYFKMAGEYKAEAAYLLRSGNLEHSLVGRKLEMETLEQAWLTLQNGRGQAILIQGEAGIGKSWLAYEFCMQVRKDGGVTKELRCLREYQNNALYPILEVLKSQLQLNEAASSQDAVTRLQTALVQACCNIEWVLPILCSWLALPIPGDFPPLQFSPDRQKKILLDALQSLILQFGQGKPLLLLIEDVHWIDPISLEFLTRMAHTLPTIQNRLPSALMLMTARPNFYAKWLNHAGSALAGLPLLQIQVERLSDLDAGQLVRKILRGKKIDPASLHRLCERADGIPLFVEELTRMLFDNKLLVEREGVVYLDERFDGSDIPATLRELLSARLSHLGSARDTAQLAAAIGREFDYQLLAKIALVDEGTLQADLDQLIAFDLIYRQRRVSGDSYLFRHALLRDAAYSAMPRQTREQTHARIALQLESRLGSQNEARLAQLAGHFAHAAMFESAIRYGSLAALNFLERALHDDAIKMVEMMQLWLPKLPTGQQLHSELDINLMLTNALMSKYGWTDTRVRDSAEHGLLLSKNSVNVQQTVPTLWVLAFYHHVASHRKTVRSLTEQLFTLSDQSSDRGLLVACHTMRGAACLIDGDLHTARASFEQVASHYDPRQHANHGYIFGLDSRVWSMAGHSNVLWLTHPDPAPAQALANTALAHARLLNHMPSLGIAQLHLALLHQFNGERDATRSVTQEMLAMAQKYGLPVIEYYAEVLHGWACRDLARIERALAWLRQAGCMLRHSYFTSLLAEVEGEAGNIASALNHIEASLQLCAQIGEQWYKPMLLLRRSSWRARLPGFDAAQARLDLQHVITLAQASGMRRCVHLAQQQLATLREAIPA